MLFSTDEKDTYFENIQHQSDSLETWKNALVPIDSITEDTFNCLSKYSHMPWDLPRSNNIDLNAHYFIQEELLISTHFHAMSYTPYDRNND